MLTSNFGKLSNPGKSSISPVFTLKQAPCHGQRTTPLQYAPGDQYSNQQLRHLIKTHVVCVILRINLICEGKVHQLHDAEDYGYIDGILG